MSSSSQTENVTKLWEDMSSRNNSKTRERLLLHYLPLVRTVAGRMKIGMPGSVEFDDLVGAGILGLMASIDGFQPERGFKFETYAYQRIRGAILDGLRDIDWLPRSYRQKVRRLEITTETLAAKLGRIPFENEVAEELGLTGDDYLRFMDQAGASAILSLDIRVSTGDEGDSGSLHDVVADETQIDPLEQLQEEDARNVALELIDQLNENEKDIIALYYYEELTFREIGEVLDLSESRICQIHTRILATLRAKLRKLR